MSPIWGYSSTENLLNTLQTVQNNAIRSIFRHEYYALGLSTNQIRSKFGILNVRQVAKYEMAMLAFKINKKIIKTNIDTAQMSSRHNYSTRNANMLYQRKFRTNSGNCMIERQIAIELNMLPMNLRNATTLRRFKIDLKKHILSNNI